MKKFTFILIAVLSVAISTYPLKYLLAEGPVSLLRTKSPELLATLLYRAAFYLHICFGGLALLIGWLQFSGRLRRKRPRIHRTIGKCYILAVLISGIPGFYIAFHATGGLSPKLGFSIGALLWVIFTAGGYRAIRKGNVALHRELLTYSYAGTFGAVTLRLWLPLLIWAYGEFLPAYQVVAWLSWVPNLALAWYLIHRQKKFSLVGQATNE